MTIIERQAQIIKLQTKCIRLLMRQLDQHGDDGYDYSTFCDWRDQIKELTKGLKDE